MRDQLHVTGPARYLYIGIIGLSLLTCGCVRVQVGTHVLAPDYNGNPKRISVIDDVDRSTTDKNIGTALIDALSICGITADLHLMNGMLIGDPSRTRLEQARFQPDLFLNIRQTTVVGIADRRAGIYVLTATDPAQGNEVWKAKITLDPATTGLTDEAAAGRHFATKVVQQMQDDGLLKCSTSTAFP